MNSAVNYFMGADRYMGTWIDMGKVNCGSPDVTLARLEIIDPYPPQARANGTDEYRGPLFFLP